MNAGDLIVITCEDGRELLGVVASVHREDGCRVSVTVDEADDETSRRVMSGHDSA